MSKIALVTGGSRGLGRAAVHALAKRGINIIFTYNTGSDSAKQVIGEVHALGSGAKAAALQLDVCQPATLDAFIVELKGALAQWHATKFDYLVNNAGIGSQSTAANTSPELLDNLYAIHLKSPFFLVQKTLDLINDNGRIVNVSTGLTRFVGPGMIAYASIKGAVEVYTRYLARELAPRGIRVNAIAPGAAATDFNGGAVRDNQVYNKAVSGMIALGRPGQPDEIGDMVAVLVSEESRWITGQRIEVSGGQLL